MKDEAFEKWDEGQLEQAKHDTDTILYNALAHADRLEIAQVQLRAALRLARKSGWDAALDVPEELLEAHREAVEYGNRFGGTEEIVKAKAAIGRWVLARRKGR